MIGVIVLVGALLLVASALVDRRRRRNRMRRDELDQLTPDDIAGASGDHLPDLAAEQALIGAAKSGAGWTHRSPRD